MGKTLPWMTFKRLPTLPKAIERSFSLDDPVRFLEMEEELPSVDRAAFGAPPAPKMAMEALMQRQDCYKQDLEKAKGNPSNPTPPRPLPMSQNQKQLNLLEKQEAVVVVQGSCSGRQKKE